MNCRLRIRLICRCTLTLIVLGFTTFSLKAQARHALVIGNDSYPGNALANARNDASAVAKELKAVGYNVTLVLDASRSVLSDRIDSFVDGLRVGDTATIYYAGHGMQIHGENYLVPTDFKLTSEQTASEQGYPLSSVLERLTSHGATTQIVILDACRDNPFLGQRSERGGWAGFGTSAGAFIAFGTSPGSTASDASGEHHGLFTKSLLKYLTSSDLDIEEMFRQVRHDVIRDSQGQQVPWISSSLIGSYHVRPELDMNGPSITLFPNQGGGVGTSEDSRSVAHANPEQPSSIRVKQREEDPLPPTSSQVVDQVATAKQAFLAGQPSVAVQALQDAVSASPQPALYRLLGLFEHAAGQDQSALKSLNLALSLAPGDARALSYKCALESLLDLTAAVTDCTKAVQAEPSADSFLTLAASQQLANQSDQAFVSSSQAIGMGGSDLAYALRGAISKTREHAGAAQRDFLRATQLAGH